MRKIFLFSSYYALHAILIKLFYTPITNQKNGEINERNKKNYTSKCSKFGIDRV